MTALLSLWLAAAAGLFNMKFNYKFKKVLTVGIIFLSFGFVSKCNSPVHIAEYNFGKCLIDFKSELFNKNNSVISPLNKSVNICGKSTDEYIYKEEKMSYSFYMSYFTDGKKCSLKIMYQGFGKADDSYLYGILDKISNEVSKHLTDTKLILIEKKKIEKASLDGNSFCDK